MPQSREIKRRIRSVENTKQITRAMKMVAAAKLRRAQDRMVAMRPYADRVDALLRYLAADIAGDEHPLFRVREEKRVLTIVIAGDRGLCGGFNTNILRAARAHLGAVKSEHRLIAIGKRAISALKKTGHLVVKSYFDVFEKLSFVLAREMATQMTEMFLENDPAKRIDAAYVVYNEFAGMMSQKPRVRKLFPIDLAELAKARKEELAGGKGVRPVYEIEPDPAAALSKLVGHRLATDLYRATVESYAAELAARMTAMEAATNNAGEMIDRLTLEYNRARQSGITAELLDIVGGANALA